MGQSWSGIKKELEQELLCDSLKGRVQYFITHYRKAHDELGVMVIRVDGNEALKADPFKWDFYTNYMCRKVKNERNIPQRNWNGKYFEHEEEDRIVEEDIEKKAVQNGIIDIYIVTDAIREYKNQSIKKSLDSENPVVRLFAILDRRVGKRGLIKIREHLNEQPDWLKYFYELRFEAEKLK